MTLVEKQQKKYTHEVKCVEKHLFVNVINTKNNNHTIIYELVKMMWGTEIKC